MTSDTKDRNRRTGGLTMYPVGEGAAGTESTKSWDRVSLVAKKWMVLTRISNELNADAIISLMDDLADEVALASATKKDQCGFIGTGASTYQGIHGVQQRLSALNGVDDGGGLVLGAGNLASEITMANYNSVIGRLPNYANARPVWFCSKWWWASTMQRLETAAGGNTIRDIQGGTSNVLFLGYPVVWTEVLPTSDANSQIAALFGDLRLAADYGDRQATTIAISDSATIGTTSVFESDEKALRWTERWDINVHDVGTATAAGPVVGLIVAAS
jgi:HK97 family phage major capsid protein